MFRILVFLFLLFTASTEVNAACPLPADGLSVFYDDGIQSSFKKGEDGTILQSNIKRQRGNTHQTITYYLSKKLGAYLKREVRINAKDLPVRKMVKFDAGH